MKIAVAQTRPATGDVETNIENHIGFALLAAAHGAQMIVFPELSLTDYNPSLAKELATHANDSRFEPLQQFCNANQLIIAAGIPTQSPGGEQISLVLFQPKAPRQVYSKTFLHADEEPFFVKGDNLPVFAINNTRIALAICYETSIPEHSANAFKNGAQVYIASVVKTTKGIDKGWATLSEIARKYNMKVLMSNSVGICVEGECGGSSAAWNEEGVLLGQLNAVDEGVLILDTETMTIIERNV